MYLLGNLSFFKIPVNCFMALDDTLCQCYLRMHVVGEGPGATLSVWRCFLSLISSLLIGVCVCVCVCVCVSHSVVSYSLWPHGLQPARLLCLEWVAISFSSANFSSSRLVATSKGALFLSPSDVYVRSFLGLFYTLIKLYYTKTWSVQTSSLAPTDFLSSRGHKSQHHTLVTAANVHCHGHRVSQERAVLWLLCQLGENEHVCSSYSPSSLLPTS